MSLMCLLQNRIQIMMHYQEAYKNEVQSNVCQSNDVMLEHLLPFRAENELLHQKAKAENEVFHQKARAENELLRQQVNTLQTIIELLLKNQNTLINEYRKDRAIQSDQQCI